MGLLGDFTFLDKYYPSNNMEIVYANDIDDNACRLFEENFRIKPDNRDIREVKSSEIPDFDILTGGFPCQSFSIVAQNPKRLGIKDDRGKLFLKCVVFCVKNNLYALLLKMLKVLCQQIRKKHFL